MSLVLALVGPGRALALSDGAVTSAADVVTDWDCPKLRALGSDLGAAFAGDHAAARFMAELAQLEGPTFDAAWARLLRFARSHPDSNSSVFLFGRRGGEMTLRSVCFDGEAGWKQVLNQPGAGGFMCSADGFFHDRVAVSARLAAIADLPDWDAAERGLRELYADIVAGGSCMGGQQFELRLGDGEPHPRVTPADGSAVAAGQTARRLANVAADNTLHSSAALLNQGSIAPVVGTITAQIFYESATQVGAQVVPGTLYLPNGTTVSIPAFSQYYSTWAGQTVGYPPSNPSYAVYNCFFGSIVWNVLTSSIEVIQQGAILDNPNATSATLTVAQQAALVSDNYIVLLKCGYAVFQTNSDGSHSTAQGFGAGGNNSDFICPCADQPVETRRGTIPAKEIRAGDAVRGEHGEWVLVTGSTPGEADSVDVTVRLPGGRSETLAVSAAHRFRSAAQAWVRAQQLEIGERLDGGGVVERVEATGRRPIQSLEVAGHVYRLGSTLSHNICYD